MRKSFKKLSRITDYLKRHPFFLLSFLGKTGFCLLQLITIFFCLHPIDSLSESARLQILSTGIQVIAGLYGLTLTGYIFFIDHMGQKAVQDHLLADIVLQIRQRFYHLIILITFNCLIAFLGGSFMLLGGGLTISFIPLTAHRLIFGETLVFMFSSIVMIMAFVISIVDPALEKKISIHAREKMGSSKNDGENMNEFLTDYREIERILREKCHDYSLDHIFHNSNFTIEGLSRLLNSKHTLDYSLLKKINQLSRYYSFTVFSKGDSVSKDICCLAKDILKELHRDKS